MDNPARGIVLPAGDRRKVHLDPDQYAALGRALDGAERRGERWQAVEAVRLLALTGCRAGEVSAKLKRAPNATCTGPRCASAIRKRGQVSDHSEGLPWKLSRLRSSAQTAPMCSQHWASKGAL